MRPETITFLRKEAKEIYKTLNEHIGVSEDDIFKVLKAEWKEGDRLQDKEVESAPIDRVDSYCHVIMDEGKDD